MQYILYSLRIFKASQRIMPDFEDPEVTCIKQETAWYDKYMPLWIFSFYTRFVKYLYGNIRSCHACYVSWNLPDQLLINFVDTADELCGCYLFCRLWIDFFIRPAD